MKKHAICYRSATPSWTSTPSTHFIHNAVHHAFTCTRQYTRSTSHRSIPHLPFHFAHVEASSQSDCRFSGCCCWLKYTESDCSGCVCLRLYFYRIVNRLKVFEAPRSLNGGPTRATTRERKRSRSLCPAPIMHGLERRRWRQLLSRVFLSASKRRAGSAPALASGRKECPGVLSQARGKVSGQLARTKICRWIDLAKHGSLSSVVCEQRLLLPHAKAQLQMDGVASAAFDTE